MREKILLLLIAVMAFLPPSLSARDFEYDGIWYTVIDEGAKTCMTRPGDYLGYPPIAGNKVEGNLKLSANPMDEAGRKFTLISIASNSFMDCSSLTSVKIPNSVTVIDREAFYHCSSLTSVEIPNSVTVIGTSAFYGCCNIKCIKIPDSVVSIGKWAFASCTQLREIVIPASVEAIGTDAFEECDLDKIYYCTTSPICFDNLDFYESVYSKAQLFLSKGAGDVSAIAPWNKFLNIEERDFISNPPIFSTPRDFKYDGVWYTVLDENGKTCETKSGVYMNGGGLNGNPDYSSDQLILPANPQDENDDVYTLVSIGSYSFWNNESIGSVTLPETVTSIGVGAFETCNKLNNIEFPVNLTSIGNGAFQSCPFAQLLLPASLVSIGEAAFMGCHNLIGIEIPENTISIGHSAFSQCDNLKNVIFSEKLRSIGNGAFYDCSQLDKVTLPENLCSIGEYAFGSCSNLVEIHVPESVTEIGMGAFWWCSKLSTSNLLGSVSVIDKQVFVGCTNLTSVKIPNTVKAIGEEAFSGCYGLTSLEIPNSVETIGDGAFSGCYGLTSLEIPNSVKIIGQRAFYNCHGLTSLEIPNSVTEIGYFAFDMHGDDGNGHSISNSLKNIEYYATQPIVATESVFSDKVYADATLTVAKAGIEAAQSTLPWSKFTNIKGIQYVDGIEIAEAPELSMCIETEKDLSVEVLPADHSDYNLVWATSDASVVTVDESGKLKALKPGTVTIAVTSDDKMGAKTEIQVTVIEHTLGDANMSGEVTIADAVHTANYSVGNEVGGFCKRAADVNKDDKITIADASGIVTIVLNQNSVASISKVRSVVEEDDMDCDKLLVDNYSGNIGETVGVGISLDSSIDYVAVQADIHIPESLDFESVTLNTPTSDYTLVSKQVDERIYRVVLYNFTNKAFENTADALFTLNLTIGEQATGNIVLTHIVASDAKGNEYTIKSIGGHKGDLSSVIVSGNENVVVKAENGRILVNGAEGSEVTICTIDGNIISHFIAQSDTEVCNVSHGIYMVTVDTYTKKVIVR